MTRELRGSLRLRAKPIVGYWREARTQNGRKSRVSTRVGQRYKLVPTIMHYKPCKHAPSDQVEGRSGEISGLDISKNGCESRSRFCFQALGSDQGWCVPPDCSANVCSVVGSVSVIATFGGGGMRTG